MEGLSIDVWESSNVEHRGFQNFHDNAEYELKAKINKQKNRKALNKYIFRISIFTIERSNKENSKTRTKTFANAKTERDADQNVRAREEGKTHRKKHKAENNTPLATLAEGSGPPQGNENQ